MDSTSSYHNSAVHTRGCSLCHQCDLGDITGDGLGSGQRVHVSMLIEVRRLGHRSCSCELVGAPPSWRQLDTAQTASYCLLDWVLGIRDVRHRSGFPHLRLDTALVLHLARKWGSAQATTCRTTIFHGPRPWCVGSCACSLVDTTPHISGKSGAPATGCCAVIRSHVPVCLLQVLSLAWD